MTQNNAGSSEAGDVVQKAALPPGEDNKGRGVIIIKPPNLVDPEVKLKEGTEEEKAAWERFFAELEIWRQKRHERLVRWYREDHPGWEPPPRQDRSWRNSIAMNRPSDILAGTAPPLPPGFPPGPTKEELMEKYRKS